MDGLKMIEERELWLINLQQRYFSLFEKIPSYNISVPIGWSKLFEDLLENIRRREVYLDYQTDKPLEEYIPVRIVQVKQKFGDLRFYYDGGNDNIILSIVVEAENIASKTCEFCGIMNEDVAKKSIFRWVNTTCNECFLERYKENDSR